MSSISDPPHFRNPPTGSELAFAPERPRQAFDSLLEEFFRWK
jgi:hypothetical protein